MSTKQNQVATQKVIFGPVPSRRLGMSLGVDIVPMKVCSYDCIYCEVGKTTNRTLLRKEYVPEDVVSRALEEYFAQEHDERLDYITIAGSGEPTLNSKIGAFIRKLKQLTDTPVAVLTNGSLFYDPEVRKDLMHADLVIPSLDAVTESVFRKINRPVSGLNIEDITEGIRRFTEEFQNEVWLEILFVKGVNEGFSEVESLAKATRRINPNKTQITTVVRPSGVGHAPPVDAYRLHEIAMMFDGHVEVVADFNRKNQPAYKERRADEIKAMLRIRPVTLDDLSASLGVHRNEVLKYLDQIGKEHRIRETEFLGKSYFTLD